MKDKVLLLSTLAIIAAVWPSTICLGQEVGEAPVQLTFDPAVDYYPAWSPDGEWIAFSSARENGQAIWKVPAEGGSPVPVTHGIDNHPCWSPDGSFIVFDTRGEAVQIIRPEGGPPIRITPASMSLPLFSYPAWDRDGSSIRLSGGEVVLSVDLPSGSVTQLFSREGHHVRASNTSPDGKYLVASVSVDGELSNSDVWLIPLSGEEPVILTDWPGWEGYPRFSPDGTMIVFMWDHEGQRSLHVISADGGDPVKITSHEGINSNPNWSPDGTRIAFASDRSGNFDIWVMELDIEALRRLVNSR